MGATGVMPRLRSNGVTVVSMSAKGAEAWAAAVPAIDGRDARHDSGKGVDRMPPGRGDFPCTH